MEARALDAVDAVITPTPIQLRNSILKLLLGQKTWQIASEQILKHWWWLMVSAPALLLVGSSVVKKMFALHQGNGVSYTVNTAAKICANALYTPIVTAVRKIAPVVNVPLHITPS